MRDKYAKSKAINEVITIIKRGEFIYYSNVAKKYKYKLIKSKKDINSF
jgi:hypothetical protein